MHLEHISHDSIKPLSSIDMTYIGDICRAHGLSGELTADLEVDLSPLIEDEEDLVFLFLERDGLKIPYRLINYRSKGKLCLLKLEDINNENSANALSGLKVYLETDYLAESEDMDTLSVCVGYTLHDENNHTIGVIEGIDESTVNCLLQVSRVDNKSIVLIPAADELIIDIDHKNKIVVLTIPEGILDL